MNAIQTYNAMIALGVSVPNISTNGTFLSYYACMEEEVAIHDTDALYILCGVMEDYLLNKRMHTDSSVMEIVPVREWGGEEWRWGCRVIGSNHDNYNKNNTHPTKQEALLACAQAVISANT